MATKQSDPVAKTQEQVFELYKQTQEAFVTGVEAWAKAARDMTEAATSMIDVSAFETAIDQTFAGAQKALEQQRDFLKRLHTVGTEAGEGS